MSKRESESNAGGAINEEVDRELVCVRERVIKSKVERVLKALGGGRGWRAGWRERRRWVEGEAGGAS